MKQVNVTIMDIPYTLACREDEENRLRQAVALLNQKMCSIRDAGKIRGNDRIAVMAALAISADLLSTKQAEGPFAGTTVSETQEQISQMHEILDTALAPQEALF